MVKPFQFSRLPEIHFKRGIIAELPSIVHRYGNKILLVTGKSSFIHSGNAVKLFQDFNEKGIEFNILSVPGEPSPEIINNATKMFKSGGINLVVAIGGGSVIDAGKAISAMMNRSESVVEFLEGVGNKEHPGTKLPFIAVPTTSGTGSEATKNAVISSIGKSGFKRSLRHDNFVPDIALIDPELTLNCPKEITSASGMDCFTQLTEAYLSVKSNEYTDALALEGFKAIKTSLTRTYKNGEDIEARTGMSFAALTSGICLANAGLGVVHGFASSLGGMYNIPHGLICATLMAKSNEINIRELRKNGNNPAALKKYAALGELFLDNGGKADNYNIDGFVSYLHKLTNDMELTSLRSSGIEEKDIDIVCSQTEIKNNPVKLTQENLAEILLESLQK
jgi:alcohol dehydrogenase class IV